MKSRLKEPDVSYPWGILFMTPTPKQDRVFFTERACMLSCFSSVQLFATLWTIARQTPLSMEILQARILEWVAMSSSKGSSPLRDQTHISSPALAGMFCTTSATWEVPLTSCKSFYSISRMLYLQLSYIEVFD